MKSATELRKEIQKTRQHLSRLEAQLRRAQYHAPMKRESEEQRIRTLESELKREYPNVQVDGSIIKLVGTLPGRGNDRRLIAEAIAEKYGK